jgi:membrane protein DedA with SNARE-associated domain
MSGLVQDYGLIALYLIVMLESGGVPLPGETALIAGDLRLARRSADRGSDRGRGRRGDRR